MVKRIIRLLSLSALIMAIAGLPALGDTAKTDDSLYAYLAGRYIAIGKEMNSDTAYHGTVLFSHDKGHLAVTRDIGGKIVKGEGRIERALGSDGVRVLRVRFIQGGQANEITYLWQSDLDNYPRLSGYAYQPDRQTRSPGLEALFIDHGTR